MAFFHPIKTIEDREQMLKSVLALQTQIRTKRKKDRLVNNSRHEKYAKIFEPITRTLKDLSDIPSTASSTNVTNGDLIDLNSPPVDNLLAPIKLPTSSDLKEEEQHLEPGELYEQALEIVPIEKRDDGRFGLNTSTRKIGDNTFTVEGDILKVVNEEDGSEFTFLIDDIDVWIILLAKSPGNFMTLSQRGTTTSPKRAPTRKKSQYVPAVKRYIEIANKLNLIETAEERGGTYKSLSKYKILTSERSAAGSGFLFSIKPPPFIKKGFNPSTVVIPSDNKGLMRELVKALSELRAGNTSMRNLVVPLAQEAKRKRILPIHLLSPDEETWVFA